MAISSVFVLDRGSGAPRLAWPLPTTRAHVRPVGNPTGAEVPDVCRGTRSWGSETLGFLELQRGLPGSQPAQGLQTTPQEWTVPASVPENRKEPLLPHPRALNISQNIP